MGKIFVADKATQDQIKQDTTNILAELRGQRPKRYGFRVKMSEANPLTRVEYLYDAVGFNRAYMDFSAGAFNYGSWGGLWFIRDNFPCMVKSDGQVDYELNPNNYALKAATGAASDIATDSYAGNAMSAIPLVWVKRYTEGDYYYCIFCEEKYDDGYEAYAHKRADGSYAAYAFHAIYEGSNVSNKLRSLSGKAPINTTTANTEETYAQANNAGKAKWHIRTWALNELIYDLLVLIGKSTNLQATFGQGHSTGGTSAANLLVTGSLNEKGQFFGYSTTTQAVKVFHIENFYADRWERILGLMYVNGEYLAKMTEAGSGYNFTGAGYEPVCDGIYGASASGGWVKTEKQTPYGKFPATVGGSETQYEADYHYFNNAIVSVPVVGGSCDNGAGCGRYLVVNNVAGAAGWHVGASLSLILPS